MSRSPNTARSSSVSAGSAPRWTRSPPPSGRRSRSRSSAAAAASRCDGLDLHLPNGQALREDIALSAEPGAPLLITGPSGAGKSTLLRAIAGLWPFGSGQVRVGQGRALFLPQRPYLPLGTLADAILYPEIDPKPGRAEIEAALRAVGLAVSGAAARRGGQLGAAPVGRRAAAHRLCPRAC